MHVSTSIQWRSGLRNGVLLFLLAWVLLGCDELSLPRSYNDCVLKHLKGVTSQAIAMQITIACKGKFPNAAPDGRSSRELSAQELAALSGNAGASLRPNGFSGTIYNGNKGITVTELRISITSNADERTISRIYATEVFISPYTTHDISLTMLPDQANQRYSWRIEGAVGY
jgi:hypothetical protein